MKINAVVGKIVFVAGRHIPLSKEHEKEGITRKKADREWGGMETTLSMQMHYL